MTYKAKMVYAIYKEQEFSQEEAQKYYYECNLDIKKRFEEEEYIIVSQNDIIAIVE